MPKPGGATTKSHGQRLNGERADAKDSRQKTYERRKALLDFGVKKAALGQGVRFPENDKPEKQLTPDEKLVRELYKDLKQPQQIFRQDCGWWVEQRETTNRIFDALCTHLPDITFEHGEFRVWVRRFAARVRSQRQLRQEIAERLVTHVLDGNTDDYLVPRDRERRLLLGPGSTVWFVAREILNRITEFNIHVVARNIEIAKLFYRSGRFADANSELQLFDREIDEETGEVRGDSLGDVASADTYIVGFHAMTEDGRLFSEDRETAQRKTATIQNLAPRRVIIVGDSYRIKSEEADHEFVLPDPQGVVNEFRVNNPEYYFVTDYLPKPFRKPQHTRLIELLKD